MHEINMEKSPEYIIDNKGNTLHVRTFWPESGEPTALVVFMHGYASHINRPHHRYVSEKFVGENYAYATMDFHGHGYSDGLKGFIESDELIIDGMTSLLIALYSSEKETQFHKLQRNVPVNTPFYIVGHSMGGAGAIVVSSLLTNVGLNAAHTEFTLQHQKDVLRVARNFRGSVFICPAIDVPTPPAVVVFLLQQLVAPLLTTTPMPNFLCSGCDTNIWSDENYLKYVHYDRYPTNEQGLSYGGPVRFGTASSVLDLTDRVKTLLPEISFPFLVFHDPQDKVCFHSGSEQLINDSATPAEDKALVHVEGGLHDLLVNKLGLLTDKILEWIAERQEKGWDRELEKPTGEGSDKTASTNQTESTESLNEMI